MPRPVAHILCALAFLQMIGGHWLALQSVAWASMIAGYVRSAGWQGALVQTLGENATPCDMCLAIERSKREEHRSPARIAPASKIEAIAPVAASLPSPHEVSFSFPPPDPERATARAEPPPHPVPIGTGLI